MGHCVRTAFVTQCVLLDGSGREFRNGIAELGMNHYTDDAGFKAISSQPDWRFKASQPPGDHPLGAYFTTLEPTESSLAARLRIPRKKIAFLFSFQDDGELRPLPGGRGEYIFYSPGDHVVPRARQTRFGPTGL